MKIKESELRNIIREAIEENCTDEGFLSNMWSGIKNVGNQAGQAVGNAASQQWNKAKQAGYRAGQAMSQGVNSMKSAYNAGAAENAQRDVQAQIEKSQQIINREQEKINQLRNKMNSYINKANKYANKANVNSINRGGGIKYQGSNIDNDDRTQDFYNNQQMTNAKKGAMLSGAKNAHKKMRQNQQQQSIALQESNLDRVINEAIEEIKAQTIQNAINNRYRDIENKENNNEFYRENGFGEVERERTNDQIRNIQHNYNDRYCTPYEPQSNKPNDSFNVSFGKEDNKNYHVNALGLSKNASAQDRLNLAKNPKFKQWQKDNGLK